MNRVKQPSKEQVREWLMQRQANPETLPDIAQIRRELGWHTPGQVTNQEHFSGGKQDESKLR